METPTFDLGAFQRRLGEAIAWYHSKAPVSDPEHDLRTAALAPPAGLKTPTELAWRDPPLPWPAGTVQGMLDRRRRDYPQILQERQAIVDEVASKRHALLSTSGSLPSQVPDDRITGRFILYYPDQNLEDGAAMMASQGFFDRDNVPPWDSWLSYVRDERERNETYVITWVPAELLELATAGIDVNPEMCIRWADEEDTEVIRRLKDAGLLR